MARAITKAETNAVAMARCNARAGAKNKGRMNGRCKSKRDAGAMVKKARKSKNSRERRFTGGVKNKRGGKSKSKRKCKTGGKGCGNDNAKNRRKGKSKSARRTKAIVRRRPLPGVTLRRLVQALALVRPNLVNRIIANRLRLREVPRQDAIKPEQRHPESLVRSSVCRAKQNLAEKALAHHAYFVEHGEVGV